MALASRATFALDWTACIGPLLSAVLTLLATQGIGIAQGAARDSRFHSARENCSAHDRNLERWVIDRADADRAGERFVAVGDRRGGESPSLVRVKMMSGEPLARPTVCDLTRGRSRSCRASALPTRNF